MNDSHCEKLITQFYNSMMYKERKVKVEKDPKRVKNAVVALLKFITAYDAGNHGRGIHCEGDLTRAEQKEYDAFMEMNAQVSEIPDRNRTDREMCTRLVSLKYFFRN